MQIPIQTYTSFYRQVFSTCCTYTPIDSVESIVFLGSGMGYLKLGDVKMPSLNDWEQKLVTAGVNFANGIISEEDLKELHEMNKRGKRHLPFVEIPYLKKNMRLYAKYLRRASIKFRKQVLLDERSTGFTYDEIMDMYAHYKVGEQSAKISRARISKFKLDEQKTYDHRFIAELAVLCRVPFSWLTNQEVLNEWETEHFIQLKNAIYSVQEFQKFIVDLLQTKQKLVKGIVLRVSEAIVLYVRIQVGPGGFFVELFNKNTTLLEFFALQEVLKDFNCDIGIMPTVVESQQIYIFIKVSKDSKLYLPDELNKSHTWKS